MASSTSSTIGVTDFEELQTPRTKSIERTLVQPHFDLCALEPYPSEISWSYHTTFDHRETQHRLQAQDAKVNNKRIAHDHIRFLLTVAGSQFKKAENLRCDELGLFTQIPEVELDTWLGNAYHASIRPLSADAAEWTDWTIPACPWTTWEASWKERGIHVTPPTKPIKPTKDSFPRRVKEGFLKKFQRKPSVQVSKSPRYVRAFRSALPSIRPRTPACKSPTPDQGGFIEHLAENVRYQNMVTNESGKGVAHAKGLDDAFATEVVIGGKRKAAVGKDETRVDKDETRVGVDGEDRPKECKDMKGDGTTENHRKREVVMTALGMVFCTAPIPPQPRSRLSKRRLSKA